MAKIRVLLYGLRGCGLIIPFPTGVVYQNQVAGMLCRHYWLEGVFVPVDWDDAADAMEDTFAGGDSLSPEDADRIDAKLAPHNARVNRSKLGESCEAWVWLTLEKGVRLVDGLEPAEAVLTWPNSD